MPKMLNHSRSAGSSRNFLTFQYSPRICTGQGFAGPQIRDLLAALIGQFLAGACSECE
jgi:hypothetical protein